MSNNFDLQEIIFHHVENSYQWNLPFLPPIQLPPFLSLHAVMLLLCSLMLIVLFVCIYKKNGAAPRGITNFFEAIIVFIRDDIAIANLGEEDGRKMTHIFCNFFFFILALNLLGLIPSFSTATSNINVTCGLALVTFCFMTFGAIHKNGLKGFLKAFIVPGIPTPILFILVPIEILGLFIKTFVLMIRLFANMLAGHIVIVAMLSLVLLFGYIALPVIFLVLFIFLLEILVAFLQAYIFTLLSAIFIGQTYHPQH